MRLLYISHYDVLRPTTNRISDMRFCEGFVENGCDVRMVVPTVYRSYNLPRDEVFAGYGIEHPFRLTMLPTPFWDSTSKWVTVPVLLSMVSAVVLREIARPNPERLVIASRDINVLLPVLQIARMLPRRLRPRVVLWAHDLLPERRRYLRVYRGVDAVVGTNTAITDDLHDLAGVPRDRLTISLNPISTRQVRELDAVSVDRCALRARHGLDGDRPLVVYTGKVGRNLAEVDALVEAAGQMPEVAFLLTGGKPIAVDYYRALCQDRGVENVTFTGFLDHYTEVVQYQRLADVLVSFYSTAHHQVDYNYPQKVTEYMLSGNPIVTPDYRATRDVLNADNAVFVKSEDVGSLIDGIRHTLAHPDQAAVLAARAQAEAREITFKTRTRKLMDFFEALP